MAFVFLQAKYYVWSSSIIAMKNKTENTAAETQNKDMQDIVSDCVNDINTDKWEQLNDYQKEWVLDSLHQAGEFLDEI
jgi:hypothetical protein